MTLKELRQKRRMTLKRLSQLSGVGLSTIGNYETGKTSISEETLKKIADVLDVTVESLRDPVSVIYDVIDGKKQQGGFKMEEQVLDEVKVRIQQFPFVDPATRKLFVDQVLHRLKEYASWCEGHYHELHEALLAHARDADGSTAGTKQKRARLRDIDTVSCAVFGTIPAGGPQSSDGASYPVRQVRVRRGRFPDGFFGLDVSGDSMNAARPEPVRDGETVILLPPALREPQHNDIVAALCDGQSTLKRLICVPGKPCTLHAESTNPAFARDIVPAHDLVIQGVVIGKL